MRCYISVYSSGESVRYLAAYHLLREYILRELREHISWRIVVADDVPHTALGLSLGAPQPLCSLPHYLREVAWKKMGVVE